MVNKSNKNFGIVRIALLGLFLVAISASAAFAQSGIKGKVKNSRGDGIPGATVTIRRDGKDLRSVKSDNKGSFTMTGLSSGTYNVVFEATGYSPGVLYNVEVGDKIRDLGGRLILTADQGNQVVIRGSVFFREGTSVTGAKIELREVTADGVSRVLATANSTVSGDFTFRRPVSTTKYRVTATFKGVSGSKELEVDNPAIYRTAITLDISRSDR